MRIFLWGSLRNSPRVPSSIPLRSSAWNPSRNCTRDHCRCFIGNVSWNWSRIKFNGMCISPIIPLWSTFKSYSKSSSESCFGNSSRSFSWDYSRSSYVIFSSLATFWEFSVGFFFDNSIASCSKNSSRSFFGSLFVSYFRNSSGSCTLILFRSSLGNSSKSCSGSFLKLSPKTVLGVPLGLFKKLLGIYS